MYISEDRLRVAKRVATVVGVFLAGVVMVAIGIALFSDADPDGDPVQVFWAGVFVVGGIMVLFAGIVAIVVKLMKD